MVKVKEAKCVKTISVNDNPLSQWFFINTSSAWIWLILRLYLGFTWFKSGFIKVTSNVWTGENAGTALKGFIGRAIALARDGEVVAWYAQFLENIVIPNSSFFSYLIAYGQLIIGMALIIGFLTRIMALFGVLMNMSFLLAGTVSLNPFLIFLAILLLMAWKVAGWYGIDRFVLPYLGTPWTIEEKEISI